MYQKRDFESPFVYRFLEGITTTAMPIGFLVGGGEIVSCLFLIYIFHAIASFFFHIAPSRITYLFDTYFIHLVILERSYNVLNNLMFYTIFLSSVFFTKEPHYKIIILHVILLVSYDSIHYQIRSIYYYMFWCLSLLSYIQFCVYCHKKNSFKVCISCCFYHIYLGVVSYIETKDHFTTPNESLLDEFFRYCCYYVFCFGVAMSLSSNPKRLRSVLTLMASLVLTSLSFHQIYCHAFSGICYGICYDDDNHLQNSMILFYMAYCIVDLFLGHFYYRQYFPFLEGYLHHTATFLFAYYFLIYQKVLLCCTLIVETSTILLSSYRIFYDNIQIKFIFSKLFTLFFVIFRIVAPTILMFRLYPLSLDPICFLMYVSGSILNVYWLRKQFTNKKKM